MKLKSFLAIGLALTIGLGFSSCKKDEPDPDPKPDPTPSKTEYAFQNGFYFNSDLLEFVDITYELTCIDGKKVTGNVKDLPTEKMNHLDGQGHDKDFVMHKFLNIEKTEKVPATTTLKMTYTGKKAPTEMFDEWIIPNFVVGCKDNFKQHVTGFFMGGVDPSRITFEDFVAKLNQDHGEVVLNIAADGTPTMEY